MKKIILFSMLAIVLLQSCTSNQRARTFGGNETVHLKPSEKFVNATWKDDNLWLITQDTIYGDYYLREKSSFGLWEGEIKIAPPILELPMAWEEIKK